jgi:tRNA pseudouridine65 synthase
VPHPVSGEMLTVACDWQALQASVSDAADWLRLAQRWPWAASTVGAGFSNF